LRGAFLIDTLACRAVTKQISQIATAAEEQTSTTREICQKVLSLNELAHQNTVSSTKPPSQPTVFKQGRRGRS